MFKTLCKTGQKWGWVIGVMALIVSAIAQARLKIEITQGTHGASPILVAPIKIASSGDWTELAPIIEENLKRSGRFAPVPFDQIPLAPAQYHKVDKETWQRMGVDNVVTAEVIQTGPDVYSVHVKLLEVFSPTDIKQKARLKNQELIVREGASRSYLLSKTFENIKKSDFRALAHHISDVIFERLTGIRGAFSTRIAYVLVNQNRSGRLFTLEVADADGHNPVALFTSKEPIMSPAWSPDGQKLAFVSFEDKRASIQVVEVATGKKRQLTQFPGINGAPAWSPDGTRLAMVLSKDGSPNIYIMDLASGQLRQITRGYSIETEPSWSPDGHKLLFTSNRGGKPQIYQLDLARDRIERVTFEGDYNARASYTPDGKHIVILHRDPTGHFSIVKQNVATQKISPLTHSELDESPSISPNGIMVLFGTQVGGRHVLGVVSIDGRGRLRLPAREGSVQEPAWSPFLS